MADFNHFSQIGEQMFEALGLVVSKTAFDLQGNIQGFIRANGQIKTGNMLNSVQVQNGSSKLEKFVIVAAPYGFFQNYGTRFIPARPFFEPGVDKTAPEFDDAVAAVTSQLGDR